GARIFLPPGGSFSPLTFRPLVLFRSRMTQKPSLKYNSQCRPEILGKRKQISQDSRLPRTSGVRTSGIVSPPPTGTSSPLPSHTMSTPSPGTPNKSRSLLIITGLRSLVQGALDTSGAFSLP